MLSEAARKWVRLISEGYTTPEELIWKRQCLSERYPLDIFLEDTITEFKKVPREEVHPSVQYFYDEEVEPSVRENFREALQIVSECFGYYAVHDGQYAKEIIKLDLIQETIVTSPVLVLADAEGRIVSEPTKKAEPV